MSSIPTIKVKPWSESQGEFVLINEADFDPEIHQLLDAPVAEAPAAPTGRRARSAAPEKAAPQGDTNEG